MLRIYHYSVLHFCTHKIKNGQMHKNKSHNNAQPHTSTHQMEKHINKEEKKRENGSKNGYYSEIGRKSAISMRLKGKGVLTVFIVATMVLWANMRWQSAKCMSVHLTHIRMLLLLLLLMLVLCGHHHFVLIAARVLQCVRATNRWRSFSFEVVSGRREKKIKIQFRITRTPSFSYPLCRLRGNVRDIVWLLLWWLCWCIWAAAAGCWWCETYEGSSTCA